jgi:hypothetical protein
VSRLDTPTPVAGRAADRTGWRGRAAALFPAAPYRRLGPAPLGLAVLVVLAGAAVSLARQPGAGALDTVWAEDGEIFLADAVNRSLPEALTGSYAGYFHTGPRLLAELAALTPAAWAAAVLAGSAALVTAALALLVYVASAAHLPSRAARMVAAAVVVVPPLAQDDVLNSIANLHWPALYALFWVLLWTPARRPGRAVGLATVALVVTSDILVVALLPLALLRVAVRRDRHSAALAAVFASGVVLQLLGLVTGTSSRETDLDPVRAAVGYVLRAVPAGLVGARWLGDDHTSARWLLLAAAAWLLVLAAVVIALRRAVGPRWTLAVVAAVHSAALYALPVVLSGVATERYALAPTMLVVVALLALLPPATTAAGGGTAGGGGAAGGGRRVPGGRTAGRAGALLVALLVVVWIVNLRVPNPRADGPSWSEELDRARAECAAETTVPDTGDPPVPDTGGAPAPAPADAPLRLTPDDGTWHAVLPCAYLAQ